MTYSGMGLLMSINNQANATEIRLKANLTEAFLQDWELGFPPAK